MWAEYHNTEWKPHKATTPRPPASNGLVNFRLEARYQRYFAQFLFPRFFEAKGFHMELVKGALR